MYRVQKGMSSSLPLPQPKKTPLPSEAPTLPLEPGTRLQLGKPRPVRGEAAELDQPALESNNYELLQL